MFNALLGFARDLYSAKMVLADTVSTVGTVIAGMMMGAQVRKLHFQRRVQSTTSTYSGMVARQRLPTSHPHMLLRYVLAASGHVPSYFQNEICAYYDARGDKTPMTAAGLEIAIWRSTKPNVGRFPRHYPRR